MATIPRTSALENGNGDGSAGRCTATLILAATAMIRPWAIGMDLRPCSRAIAQRPRTALPNFLPCTAASMPSAHADYPRLPACLCHLTVDERSGPIRAGVDAMAIETGLSEALPLRGVREMAAAALCVSD